MSELTDTLAAEAESAIPRVATRVLVAEDQEPLRRVLVRDLSQKGFDVRSVEDGAAGLALLMQEDFDVALVDIHMPKLSGLDLLKGAREAGTRTEIIMMTGFGDIETAVTAVKGGAVNFLTKPFVSTEAVAIAITNAAKGRQLRERASDLERALEAGQRRRTGNIIGNSVQMLEVHKLITTVSQVNSTVLILGESGTGKELVAAAIHQGSARANKPLVVVNCAAIPADLVESELFGHVRGAFTGAQNPRAGLFEAADGGTLFLDEIGDLPMAAQVKLLRTLQSGEVKRVGADTTRRVDVRVLAATNVDLKAAVAAGRFRQDLYYRLAVIGINLPPLRDRPDDAILLAHHFLQKYSRLGKRQYFGNDALQAIEDYSWPGNVRELEHAVEHATVLSRDEVISASALPFSVEKRTSSVGPTIALEGVDMRQLAEVEYATAKKNALRSFNEAYVSAALARAEGNVTLAARYAGLDRSNFRRLTRKNDA